MQNTTDRQRLLRQFGQEPAHPAAVVAKCAAGLTILIGIALIGVTVPPDDAASRAAANPGRAVNTQRAAVATPQRTDTNITARTPAPEPPARGSGLQSHP